MLAAVADRIAVDFVVVEEQLDADCCYGFTVASVQ
jgi:hypothetical protein